MSKQTAAKLITSSACRDVAGDTDPSSAIGVILKSWILHTLTELQDETILERMKPEPVIWYMAMFEFLSEGMLRNLEAPEYKRHAWHIDIEVPNRVAKLSL